MTYRNRKLLDLARDQACVLCGIQDATVVAAHSNMGEHGKGMGHKAHDGMTAWLCYECHANLDQGRALTKDQKQDHMLRAICKTYMKLWDLNLIGVKA